MAVGVGRAAPSPIAACASAITSTIPSPQKVGQRAWYQSGAVGSELAPELVVAAECGKSPPAMSVSFSKPFHCIASSGAERSVAATPSAKSVRGAGRVRSTRYVPDGRTTSV
eukprot:6981853-Prymnesium_polylepis.2